MGVGLDFGSLGQNFPPPPQTGPLDPPLLRYAGTGSSSGHKSD